MKGFKSTSANPYTYTQSGVWKKGQYTFQAIVISDSGYAIAFQKPDLSWDVIDLSWQVQAGQYCSVLESGFTLEYDAVAFKLIANDVTGEVVVFLPMLEQGANPSTPIAHEEDLRGMDGDNHEFIFTRNDTGIAPDAPLSTQEDDHIPIDDSVEPPVIWTDNPQGVTKELPFEFVSMREKKVGVWLDFSPPSLWAKWSEDGLSVYLRKQGHYESRWVGTEKVTDIVGGEMFGETELIKVTAVFHKGEEDVAPSESLSRGFQWYVNGVHLPAFDDQHYITLDSSYGDGFADIVKLSYIVNSLREEIEVEVMNISAGMDGIGEEFIFKANNSNTEPPVLPHPTDEGYQDDDYHGDWSDDPVAPTELNQYVWVAMRKKVGGIWEAFGTPSLWTWWVTDGGDAAYWELHSSAPLIYKDAEDASTSGVHTSITLSGRYVAGVSSQNGGYISVQPNGGVEDTPLISPRVFTPPNNAGVDEYVIRLYDDASKTTLLDTMTVPIAFKGEKGVSAINITLSNEKDALPATADGVVTDYNGSGTTIWVFEGATELSYGTGNGEYQVFAIGSNISPDSTPTTNGNARVYGNASSMGAAKTAVITFTVSGKTFGGESFSFDKVQNFTKAERGDTGASAPLLYLSASSHVMKCNPDNTPQAGQTILFEAKLQNVTGTASFDATPYDDAGTALTTIILGGTGNTRTITNEQWLATYKRIEVVATLGSLTDKVTIHRLADGATGENVIVGFLTNENITLQASNAGVVSSFTPANGEFWVYNGTTKVTSGITFSKVSQTGCTAVITSAGVYSVSAMSADNATVVLRAVYSGVTIDKVLTLSKSKAGADGITISQNQQGHTYRADLNGDIIGALANGMVELTITSGSTPITCPSATSGGTPTTDGTYRVTRTLGDGIDTTQSVSGGKYRITPKELTVDEATVELEIKIMMDGVVTSYPLTLTYLKQFDGADGKSTEFIFKGSTSDTTAPTLPSTSQQDDWYGQGTANEWNDDSIEPTKTLPYVWASQRKKVDGVWGAFMPPKVWLRWTEDGDGITSTTIEYAKSEIGTTPPSDGWSTSIPEATQGWYLWTRTTTTYKVAATTVSYSVSHWAKDGDGIVSTTIEYAKSSSGTTIPESDWSTSIPSPTKGWYLWTRTTTVYKTSPTTVAYTTSYWAEDGDGIVSTTIHYARSSIGTTPPSDGWGTSIPEAIQGWYLWTRTTITYRVAATTVSYSVSHWAEDGDGIVSTTMHYAKSSSATTIPSDWSTTPPTPTKGMYLWTRTTTVYKKSPTTVAYTTSYWAKDGDDAKSITLSANATKITVGKGNISSPTQISVKATAVNTTVETWEYSTDGGAFTATKPSFVTVVSTSERTISTSTLFKTITLRASRVADEASGIITISREGGAPYVDSTTRTWWEWSYTSNLYVDTGMSPVGSDGVIPYPAGYYDNTKRYRREAEYAPYVQYEGKLYLLIKDTPNAGIATSNTTYWKAFNHWEAVFVDSLVAAFAKIGGAVFTGDTSEVASGIRGRMISEMGEDGTTTFANYTGDGGSWQPNIMLDFRTGKVKFANADIVGHITATSGSIGGVNIENETLSVATPTTNGILSSVDKAYLEQLKTLFQYDAGNDAIKALKPLYSTSGVSAYGLGSGGSSGGGGGINMMQGWTIPVGTENYYAPANLVVPFYNDIRARVANLEGGGTTPTQHTHVIGDITGLQSALDGKASSTHSHSWTQITSKPDTFTPSTHSHSWSQITSKPSTFAPSAHTHTKSQITDFPTTWAWGNLTDVPSTFAPSSHSHSWSQITSKPSTFTPSAHTLGSHSDVTITSIASGEILKWDGTKWINNTLSEAGISASSHSHSWSQITSKPSSFTPSSHSHSWSSITSKPSTFTPSTHTHTSAQISDATNLNTASMIVKRDSSGNFSAGTITASLSGNASSATNLSRSIVAGDGLTGGGKLDANRTLTLGTPSSITLSSTNSVGASNHAHSLALGGTTSQYLNGATKLVTIPTITAGKGLTGGGQLTATRTLTLGTPSTLSNATTNTVGTDSHAHAITTTTVGAASTIVATDASGGIRGNIIRIGSNWTLELSGSELVFKYSGVIKQRMLSNGTILGTGGVTAFATN